MIDILLFMWVYGVFLKICCTACFYGCERGKICDFWGKKRCFRAFLGEIWRKIGIFVCKSENEVAILSCFVAVEISEKVRRRYGYPMMKVSIS